MTGISIKLSVLAIIATISLAMPSKAEPTPEAKAYLDHALELIRVNHRNSAKSDWSKIAEQAQIDIVSAKIPKDAYPAIRRVLSSLAERHSFFIAARSNDETAKEAPQNEPAPVAMPSWKLEDKHFGILALPGLNTMYDDEGKRAFEYQMTARNGLMQMDKAKICGWIIDLRENDGGNMWPMLSGIDPLLGPSPFGSFPTDKNGAEKWVRANSYIYPTSEQVVETPPNFQLQHAAAPVAVLVGPTTASSGEMTAISFIGRKDARLFGNPTAGYMSANKTYPLSDGAILLLTSAGAADRLGREYVGPILPHEQTDSEKSVLAAKQWLKTKCKK
jgi:carboxyl-terminal processing protease